MLVALVTILHILVAVILITSVLLQSGKGADLAGAFGGGGSQTAFGSRGPVTFLARLTTGAAVTFMVTSLALAVLHSRADMASGSNLPAEDPRPVTQPATVPPASPAAAPAGSEPATPAQPPAGGESTAPEPGAPPATAPPGP